jgi:hypothetical protein
VVVMTGYLPPGVPEMLRASGDGPLVLLYKPFEIGALVRALHRLVPGGGDAVPLAAREAGCFH